MDGCRSKIEKLLASYQNLLAVAQSQPGSDAAFAAFEPNFFNHMVLDLDNYFLHRSRNMEGQDGNPLKELRIICGSIRDNGGKLVSEKVIKYDPAKAVLELNIGDEIKLHADGFARLAEAVFAGIEAKYPG